VIEAVGVHQFVHWKAGDGGCDEPHRPGCATIYAGGGIRRVRSLNLVGLKRAGMADQGEAQPSKKLSALSPLWLTAKSSLRTIRPAVG